MALLGARSRLRHLAPCAGLGNLRYFIGFAWHADWQKADIPSQLLQSQPKHRLFLRIRCSDVEACMLLGVLYMNLVNPLYMRRAQVWKINV